MDVHPRISCFLEPNLLWVPKKLSIIIPLHLSYHSGRKSSSIRSFSLVPTMLLKELEEYGYTVTPELEKALDVEKLLRKTLFRLIKCSK